MIYAVVLIYGYRTLHLQPALLGVVLGFSNLGFLGALLSGRIRKHLGLRVTLMGALLVGSAAAACMLLAQLAVPYVVLFVTWAVIAISTPIYNVNQISYRQALVDVRLQGRMNATMRTFVWGTPPLGALLGGYMATLIGVPQTILLGAVLSSVAALWLLPLRERSTASELSVA